MCGIAGIVSQTPLDSNYLDSTLDLLHHRGPDDHGVWKDSHIQLGHTRLAILDLTPSGHQPMTLLGGRYWITFNGEIYNYLELRQELLQAGYHFVSQGDTEVLLAAYAHWGVSCLSKLCGMFAFALWDRQTQQLFIARDRTGEKPLYYGWGQGRFYFASELKALLALLPYTPDLDPVSIDLYLHYQFVPEPRTPLIGVWKLPCAHYGLLSLHSWDLKQQRYWSLIPSVPVEGNPSTLIQERLVQSIQFTLRSDVPVGIALSGGVDSGAISAIATQYQKNLQAFTIGYQGRPPCDERSQAMELARTLGIPFFEIELSPEDLINDFPNLVAICDDPIADLAAYGHYAVVKIAGDHGIKVMLNGLGGDELFWGYNYLKDCVRLSQQKVDILNDFHIPYPISKGLEQLTTIPLARRLAHSTKIPSFLRSFIRFTLEMGYMGLHRPHQQVFYNLRHDFLETLQYRQSLYPKHFASKIPKDNPFQPFERSVKAKSEVPGIICELLFQTWLASNCLALGDRVSMSCGVETRLPFLDHRLIELVMGLRMLNPDHALDDNKFWLREALVGVLPEQVLRRPKKGFEPPYQQWIEALINKYKPWLKNSYLAQRGIISPIFLQRLFRSQGNLNLKYRLIFLEVWCRNLLDPLS